MFTTKKKLNTQIAETEYWFNKCTELEAQITELKEEKARTYRKAYSKGYYTGKKQAKVVEMHSA